MFASLKALYKILKYDKKKLKTNHPKATYCDTIMWKVQNKQIHGVENQLFVKGQEEGEGKSDYYWVWGFILWDNENILELDNVDSHATLWI